MDLEQVKRLTLVGLFDKSDRLREELVLKGGNLLDIVFAVSTRSSIDLDFSIAGNIPAEEIRSECEHALKSVFSANKYQVIDLRIHEKPQWTSEDLKDFWGGYELEFKLVSDAIFAKHKDNVSELRKHALPLGPTGSPTFKVDISKYEYCEGKLPHALDGSTIYTYSPEMCIAEKLRAICQQMPEYLQTIHRSHTSGRARDFYDIHMLFQEYRINFANPEFQQIVRSVFAAKRVPLKLIGDIALHAAIHEQDFAAIRDTIRPGINLESLDFYVNSVVRESEKLKPLWHV